MESTTTPANPSITKEVKYPINSSTMYEHRQKTALDGSGNRYWDASAPAPAVEWRQPDCTVPAVRVRPRGRSRATSVTHGRGGARSVEGWSAGGGPRASWNQLANLNTGADAQTGYLAGPCGFPTPRGASPYSLLSDSTTNFYLDTSNPNALNLRQVTLEPPGFTPPGSNPQFLAVAGVPELPAGCAAFHPAGYFVGVGQRRSQAGDAPENTTAADDRRGCAGCLLLAHPEGRVDDLTRRGRGGAGRDNAGPRVRRSHRLHHSGAGCQAFESMVNSQAVLHQPQPGVALFLAIDGDTESGRLAIPGHSIDAGGSSTSSQHLEGTSDSTSTGQCKPISTAWASTPPRSRSSSGGTIVYALNYEVIPIMGGNPPGFARAIRITLLGSEHVIVGAGCSV